MAELRSPPLWLGLGTSHRSPQRSSLWANQAATKGERTTGRETQLRALPSKTLAMAFVHTLLLQPADVSFLLRTCFSRDVDFGSVGLSFRPVAPQPSPTLQIARKRFLSFYFGT